MAERDVPVLDAQPAPTVDDADVLGDVAGGEHARDRAAQLGVHGDPAAVADRQPGAAREHHVRRDARADHDRVGGQLAAGPRDHSGHAPVGTLEPVELLAAEDLDPVLAEPVMEEAGRRLAERPAERELLDHHHRAPAAELGQRGGDLAGDVGAADQDDALAGGVLADRVAVAERPQVVDALQLGAGHVQPPDVGTGGQQQLPEGDLLLRRQPSGPRLQVELHRRGARQQLDRLLLIPGGFLHERVTAALGALEVALGQRWAVIRRVGLAPDEQNRPVGAGAAQPAGAVAGGDAAADEQVIDVSVGHGDDLPPDGLLDPHGREARRDLVLETGIEDQQHLIAGLDDRVALGDEPGAVAQHRDDQRAVGQGDVADHGPGGRRPLADLELDDLEVLLFEREQLNEAVLGHLMLDQAQDQVGRRHRGLDAEQLEVVEVARVVDPGHDPLAAVLLLGHLADEDVVLVVSGDRDHQVGSLDPRPLEHPHLGGVAVLHGVLELLLDDPVAPVVGLDQGHLAVLGDQLAGEVPPHLPGPGDDDVHRCDAPSRPGVGTLVADHSLGVEHDVLGLIDGLLGRADRLQPPLGVPQGARRVGDAHHDTGDVEPALGQLGDHQIGVVAPRRRHEHIRSLDARLDQSVDLQCRSDREAASRILPRRRLVLVQSLVRERIGVEHRDLVARLERALGDR